MPSAKETPAIDKTLITGGAGFIGGFVAEALVARGRSVDIIDSLARGRRDAFLEKLLSSDKVRFYERDLLDSQALDDLGDDYTHVIHLAALLGVQNVLERPFRTLRDNAMLTATALGFAQKQRRLQRLVFASTSEVYAGSLQYMDMPIPTPETTPLALSALDEPRTSYMLSKLYGEAMVQHCGAPFTIIRPHNVYGPRMGMAHVIPQLLEKAYRAQDGDSLEVFSVDHSRTFCFIEDAVEMIVRACETPACEGSTLNVGTQAPEVSIGDLADKVIAAVGKRLTIAPMPATPGSPSRRCPDMSRTSRLTGYRSRISLEEGIRRTYDWYRARVFERNEPEVAR